jgi:Acyl-CoA dehydrogenases
MIGHTEAQEAIRRTVREFARNEVQPGAHERDATGHFDYGLYRRLCELGLAGMPFREEFGGAAADSLSFCLALEEVSRLDMSLGLTLWVGIQGALSMTHGSEEQISAWRDSYVAPTICGEVVSAGAITEPDAGSDTAAIKTRATLDGHEWVVKGNKIFISNAGLDNCAFAMVLCRTDEGFGIVSYRRARPVSRWDQR